MLSNTNLHVLHSGFQLIFGASHHDTTPITNLWTNVVVMPACLTKFTVPPY
jgi:hypothetical protein